jgi:DNA-binding NarL/FixJ family response regulator
MPPDLRVHFLEHGARRFAVISFSTLPEAKLTLAERDVLVGVLAGKSNSEIAAERRTRTRTVANQVASAFEKLGVSSRSELVARCSRQGIVR